MDIETTMGRVGIALRIKSSKVQQHPLESRKRNIRGERHEAVCVLSCDVALRLSGALKKPLARGIAVRRTKAGGALINVTSTMF